MNLTNTQFSIAGQQTDCIRIACEAALNGITAADIRSSIADAMKFNCPVVYIDAKEVEEVDLSGINEIINSHYTLSKANSKLVFVYRRHSAVEKWVETTGLDAFIDTAIIPAN
jgi:anti-anti-sigma regulatory factor